MKKNEQVKRPTIEKECACGCGEVFISKWHRGRKRYAEFARYHGVRKKPIKAFDLADPLYSYLLGIVQSDSHFRRQERNRGSLTLELSIRDLDILQQLQSLIPVKSTISKRVRNTNFKDNYESACWTVHDIRFREFLVANGLPYGKKSTVVKPPNGNISWNDYFRGWIDGDGSLGFTERNVPFISLCTSSDGIAETYLYFIKEIVGKEKISNRNARDSAYNVVLTAEDAQLMASKLYYEGCLALKRKLDVAKEILSWIRPEGMKRVPNKKFWTSEEDNFILSHSVEKSMEVLNRSESSVKTRLLRLRNPSKYENKS